MATKTLNLKSTGVQFSCGGTIDDGWGDTYINGIEAKSKKNSGKANITVNIPTVMSGINYSKINSIKLSFNCSGWWDRYEQGAMYLGWEEANGTLHLIENGKTIGFYSTPTYHTTGDISIGTCLLSDGRVVFGFYGYNNRVVASNWWYVTNLSIVIDYVESYTLTVTAGTGGTVSGGGTYERGKTATLTATPKTGYKFVKWSDGNTNATRTVTVNGNATYTATFEKINPPVYVKDKQCSEIYIDETNKTIYFVGGVAYSDTKDVFDTVDGWHFKSTLSTDGKPTSASKSVEKIYIGTTQIL